MNPNEKMKAIQEQRLNQATQRDLTGSAGKLGVIARWLGSPIIRQGGGLFDESYLDNPFEIPQEGIPTADRDDHLHTVGYIFDGLSRGMHIEIKYTIFDSKLTAYYKGYCVFTEVAGELQSYAPFPEWEEMIAKLYGQADGVRRSVKEEQDAVNEVEYQKEKTSFLQALRLRWGL